MYNLIKTFIVATFVVVNTITLGGSTRQPSNYTPTLTQIEDIRVFREQLLIKDKDIKIVKRNSIVKPKEDKIVKSKPEIFVEVTENKEPVRNKEENSEVVLDTKDKEENELSKDNIKDDTKKVDETVEELDNLKLDKDENIVIQANEVAYNDVVGEVYFSEVAYEEKITKEETVEEETVVELETEEIKEVVVEELEEEVMEEETVEEDIVIELPTQEVGLREYALRFYGGSYVWGGSSPSSGFDCSGLVQYIYLNYYNISLPRTASEQAVTGFEVAKSNLIAGDLIIFQNSYSSYPDHIGIYIGNGEYLHASSPSRGITTDSIYGNYFDSSCISVRRHFGEEIVIQEEQEDYVEEQEEIVEDYVEEQEDIVEDIVEEENNSYTITMNATAYTHTGNPTASGVYPQAYHTVSVDPNVIPLGTRMYIEGYGYAVAEDTGSAIKGNILDLFFDTEEECVNWGYRSVNVTILD